MSLQDFINSTEPLSDVFSTAHAEDAWNYMNDPDSFQISLNLDEMNLNTNRIVLEGIDVLNAIMMLMTTNETEIVPNNNLDIV